MKDKIVLLLRQYREIIAYLIFGVLTTLVNIVVYFVTSNLLGINYLISNFLAWFISVLFAYITNRAYVFESTSSQFIKEAIKFFGSRLTTGVIDMGLMWLLVSFAPINDILIKILVNIIVIVLNYIFSKLFVFKEG